MYAACREGNPIFVKLWEAKVNPVINTWLTHILPFPSSLHKTRKWRAGKGEVAYLEQEMAESKEIFTSLETV